MKVAVLGLGYVGMTAAACMASQGHTVIGIDPSQSKIDLVRAGRSPISEPGLEDLISTAVEAGLLEAHGAITPGVADCDLAIVCVGTPSAVDGSHNMTFIADVSRQLAELLASHPDSRLTVAYRSTIRPGSVDELIIPIFESVLGTDADRFTIVYNPEFLRESSAIKDYFAPPKIVVGTHDGLPNAELEELNAEIDAPTFVVRYRESEITKFVDNSFHAVKTAFANEVGRICVSLGISAAEVHKIFVSDTKLNISPYYLRPGGAFGGSCLPKDVRALQHIAQTTGQKTDLVNSLIATNENHKEFVFRHCTAGLDHGASVLMLGLAFKNESDDLRESPNIDLARMLLTAGFDLAIYDPFVQPQHLVGQNLGVLSNSPFVRELLVDDEAVAGRTWDLVIDTRSVAGDLGITAKNVIDVNRLA